MSALDPKRVETARVLKAGRPAASLVRDRTGVTFAYDDGYRGPAVATSLPVAREPVRVEGGALPAFFTGLLPEGRRLTALRHAVKTSADDELSLLLAVGADVVGDVQVLAEGESLEGRADKNVPSLDEVSFRELFHHALGKDLPDRTALAGAQDKVSGRMIALPVTLDGAAFLLKLDPPEYSHFVENEAFFLAAARRSGLEVNEASIVRDRDGQPGLLIPRFDRIARPGEAELIRRPQEDACQVLGYYPADKYRLTTEELIQGLVAQTQAPIVAARDLLRQFAFAYLTCNGDAHGKNFSIVHEDGEWRVSPAYDLPSTHPYGNVSMALSINGKTREDITRADFIALGESCRVAERAVRRVLDSLVEAAPGWIGRLDELPFDDRRVHELRRACEYRLERLAML